MILKIVIFIAGILAIVIGGPIFLLMYAAGAWADRRDRIRYQKRVLDSSTRKVIGSNCRSG